MADPIDTLTIVLTADAADYNRVLDEASRTVTRVAGTMEGEGTRAAKSLADVLKFQADTWSMSANETRLYAAALKGATAEELESARSQAARLSTLSEAAEKLAKIRQMELGGVVRRTSAADTTAAEQRKQEEATQAAKTADRERWAGLRLQKQQAADVELVRQQETAAAAQRTADAALFEGMRRAEETAQANRATDRERWAALRLAKQQAADVALIQQQEVAAGQQARQQKQASLERAAIAAERAAFEERAVDNAIRSQVRLQSGVGQTRGALDGLGGGLKNSSFAIQQLAFGLQDASSVYGLGGFSMALRAASNNVIQFASLINPLYGTVVALGATGLGLLVDYFSKTGDAAKEATREMQEFEKWIRKIGETPATAARAAGFNVDTRTKTGTGDITTTREQLEREIEINHDMMVARNKAMDKLRGEATKIRESTVTGGGIDDPHNPRGLHQRTAEQIKALEELVKAIDGHEEDQRKAVEKHKEIVAQRQTLDTNAAAYQQAAAMEWQRARDKAIGDALKLDAKAESDTRIHINNMREQARLYREEGVGPGRAFTPYRSENMQDRERQDREKVAREGLDLERQVAERRQQVGDARAAAHGFRAEDHATELAILRSITGAITAETAALLQEAAALDQSAVAARRANQERLNREGHTAMVADLQTEIDLLRQGTRAAEEYHTGGHAQRQGAIRRMEQDTTGKYTKDEITKAKARDAELFGLEKEKKLREEAGAIMARSDAPQKLAMDRVTQLNKLWQAGLLSLYAYRKELADIYNDTLKPYTVDLHVTGLQSMKSGSIESAVSGIESDLAAMRGRNAFAFPPPGGAFGGLPGVPGGIPAVLPGNIPAGPFAGALGVPGGPLAPAALQANPLAFKSLTARGRFKELRQQQQETRFKAIDARKQQKRDNTIKLNDSRRNISNINQGQRGRAPQYAGIGPADVGRGDRIADRVGPNRTVRAERKYNTLARDEEIRKQQTEREDARREKAENLLEKIATNTQASLVVRAADLNSGNGGGY